MTRKMILLTFGLLAFLGKPYAQQQNFRVSKNIARQNFVDNVGREGIRFELNVNVSGYCNKDVWIYVYLYDANKKKLVNPYAASSYKSPTNELCTSRGARVLYESSNFKDFTLFLPYSDFPNKKGTKNYYYCVFAYSNGWLTGNSGYLPLTIQWTAGGVNASGYVAHNCMDCNGNGLCRYCNGRGNMMFGSSRTFTICGACSGGGQCPICRGTKINVYARAVNTGGGTGSYGANVPPSNPTNGQPQSNSMTCGICNGSGLCSICGGRGERRLGGDGRLVDCWRCHGTRKCQICYGDGYIYR